MSTTKTRTLKRTQRRFSVYQVQKAKETDQQQQKQKQEKLQQQQLSHNQEQDQKDRYQDEVQIPLQEQGQVKQEIKQEEVLNMDQGHEQEQKDHCQDEEQTLQQEQRQTKKEIKQEQDLDLGQGQTQEQEQTESPQLQTEPSLEVEKVSKHTQTQKEQNFWYWVPNLRDDSQWECLVKGKGQEILETVFSSKSTTRENVSSQQRGTMPATETAQQRTQARTTITLPHTHYSNPAHGARPMGVQHRCIHSDPSAGCSHYAQGTRHYCQRGIPHGRMPAPQMFPPETQPARNMGLHPGACSFVGFPAPAPAPMQNSVMPQEPQQPSNANVQSPSLDDCINDTVATMQAFLACIIMLHRQHPDLTPLQIRRKLTRAFQQMLGDVGNGPQQ